MANCLATKVPTRLAPCSEVCVPSVVSLLVQPDHAKAHPVAAVGDEVANLEDGIASLDRLERGQQDDLGFRTEGRQQFTTIAYGLGKGDDLAGGVFHEALAVGSKGSLCRHRQGLWP